MPPLRMRREERTAKYINKLRSFGKQNRTSQYFTNWKNKQRLKKDSPFGIIYKNNICKDEVTDTYLTNPIIPHVGLPKVYFHLNLKQTVNKNEHPEYLKQLALETINMIPKNAKKIFTDGSKDEFGHTGSGVLIMENEINKTLKLRNPDHSSVFRSELIAIDSALKSIARDTDTKYIWILTDSRSSIQHLQNYQDVHDATGIHILQQLRELSQKIDIHFQWIPSHVGIQGNEIADSLAKEGSKGITPETEQLTYTEIYSKFKMKTNQKWKLPPQHSWYKAKNPGDSIRTTLQRKEQTAIARLKTGHLKTLKIIDGKKTFPICPKCDTKEASPQHILQCINSSTTDLWNKPTDVIKLVQNNNLMDMV